MTELDDLIERVEKATGPDRELGKDILRFIGWVRENDGTWVSPKGQAWFDYNPGFPNPTASLDAAKTLIPAGWEWALYSEDGRKCAEMGDPSLNITSEHETSEELALTAATLKAIKAGAA